MLNLVGTTQKISITRSAASDIDAAASWVDCDNATPSAQVFTPGESHAAFASAATGDLVVAPAASTTMRNVKFLSLRNKHAATACDVTVNLDVSSTLYTLFKCSLLAGESLVCREGVWFHFDVYGGVYGPSLPIGSDTVVGGVQLATTGEMATGTSTTAVVTPGRLYLHPTSAKKWLSCDAAGALQQSYGISSLTDTGTGIVTVNFTAGFAAATYACITDVEQAGTAYTATLTRRSCLHNTSRATGSVALICLDTAATTNVVKDPVSWHAVFYGVLA